MENQFSNVFFACWEFLNIAILQILPLNTRSVFSDFRDNSFEVSWDCQSQATTAGRDSAVHPEERCVRGASYWFGKISNFPSNSRCLCTFVLSWIRLPCKSYITSDLSVAIPMKVPIWMSWRHRISAACLSGDKVDEGWVMTSLRMAFGLLCHWFFISIWSLRGLLEELLCSSRTSQILICICSRLRRKSHQIATLGCPTPNTQICIRNM